MNTIILGAAVLMCVACTGCLEVLSVNPFYGKGDVITDDRFTGRWVDKNDSKSDTTREFFEIKRGSGTVYAVELHGESSMKAVYAATLFKINDKMYMDISPSADIADYIAGHRIIKVLRLSPTLRYSELSNTWFAQQLMATSGFVQHAAYAKNANDQIDGKITLYGSTAELQTFIADHFDDPAAWSTPKELSHP